MAAAELNEHLKMIFLITFLVLSLGLLLEWYLLRRSSRYSILVPVFFLIYPLFRVPVIMTYESGWFYAVVELLYIFIPFIISLVCFLTAKGMEKKRHNKEMEKLKIQDL